MRASLRALFPALLLAASMQAGGARVERLAELGLTLTLPPLEGFTSRGPKRWHGQLGPSVVEIALETLPSEKYGLTEPDDVLDIGPSFWRDPGQGRNDPGSRRALAGRFGYAAYASYERTELRDAAGATVGLRFLLGGLLADAGYWITLEASPPPAAEDEAVLFAFLSAGIAYDGPVREHGWTDEEARERWERDAPLAVRSKLVPPIRTAHYIVLTDSSGGPTFGRRMEECHAAIQRLFPFDDVPGRRLLPVFLFRTAAEYFEFHSTMTGVPLELAERTKGFAARDYYATWNDASGDPMHLHEATHQLFANRLGLSGGGAWFQEGVAEYVATKPGERSGAAALVKKGRFVPLASFLKMPELFAPSSTDASGGDQDIDQYRQAALLIEFLRESKWAKERFPACLQRVGRIPAGNRAEIESAIEEIYGVGIDGLEERWVEYCRRR